MFSSMGALGLAAVGWATQAVKGRRFALHGNVCTMPLLGRSSTGGSGLTGLCAAGGAQRPPGDILQLR